MGTIYGQGIFVKQLDSNVHDIHANLGGIGVKEGRVNILHSFNIIIMRGS